MSNKEVALLKKKVVELKSTIETDWRPRMKSASEKLVVLNKKAEELKAVKAENAQLKKQLAAGGLEKVKKQKEALQEKVEKLKEDNYK